MDAVAAAEAWAGPGRMESGDDPFAPTLAEAMTDEMRDWQHGRAPMSRRCTLLKAIRA